MSALSGKRVVVIGGTSGMGLGAVRAAGAAGAGVVAAGRRPVADRTSEPGPVSHAVVDVTDEASVRSLFERVGELDHLLVTAAPSPGSPGAFLEQDVTAARAYLDAKLFGSWAAARYAAPRMAAGGSITFLTGGAAVRPRPGASMVTTSFAALEALSTALAVELAPLRVNTLRPGFTDSPMWDGLDATGRERLRRDVAAALPSGRIGTSADVGHAALFLMTNPQVTGTVLEVSGGETLVDHVEVAA